MSLPQSTEKWQYLSYPRNKFKESLTRVCFFARSWELFYFIAMFHSYGTVSWVCAILLVSLRVQNPYHVRSKQIRSSMKLKQVIFMTLKKMLPTMSALRVPLIFRHDRNLNKPEVYKLGLANSREKLNFHSREFSRPIPGFPGKAKLLMFLNYK